MGMYFSSLKATYLNSNKLWICNGEFRMILVLNGDYFLKQH
jgi:hypothetical protein